MVQKPSFQANEFASDKWPAWAFYLWMLGGPVALTAFTFLICLQYPGGISGIWWDPLSWYIPQRFYGVLAVAIYSTLANIIGWVLITFLGIGRD